MPIPRLRHLARWIVGAVIVIAALAVGGPFLYIHFFNRAPAALSLPASPTSAGTSSTGTAAGNTSVAGTSSTGTAAGSTPVAGTWNASTSSVVEYRVNEVLMGQNTTAVGRSSSVTGHLTIVGTNVTAASFSVPMSTVHSDKSQRDAQFDGRIMDVSRYPTGKFVLTKAIDLAPVPASNTVKGFTAHGNLTLHGTTKPVTFTLKAELVNGRINVSGRIPVLFSDYNIANPSFGGFVTTQDHGLLDFLLVFAKG